MDAPACLAHLPSGQREGQALASVLALAVLAVAAGRSPVFVLRYGHGVGDQTAYRTVLESSHHECHAGRNGIVTQRTTLECTVTITGFRDRIIDLETRVQSAAMGKIARCDIMSRTRFDHPPSARTKGCPDVVTIECRATVELLDRVAHPNILKSPAFFHLSWCLVGSASLSDCCGLSVHSL